MKSTIELFVPGRLCLFGEHSDWAGLHRMLNAKILPGKAIVIGTEQGIYAHAKKNKMFCIHSSLEAYQNQCLECEMDSEQLRKIANKGGFFSYVAGVASYVNDCYHVDGLDIEITKMDLPMKSGLSSSAAICVLVARAFNELYELHLNIRGEMNIAFCGEQRTPSRCGRLDQGCAYGNIPVCMTFDGDEIDVRRIAVKGEFYWVFADLCAKKDTVKILGDLNKCYPFPQDDKDILVHQALGEDNENIVNKAIECLASGDTETLGKLMTEAQDNFDTKVAPVCSKELTAPVLHRILKDAMVEKLTFGAKGVGSQGDGSVQFLAKSKECQRGLIEYLNNTGMHAYGLTIKQKCKIRKAIIPVAGFGTRLYPATRLLKKEFFPVVDRDGMVKPGILILLEELYQAGIEQIYLVIGKEEQCLYENFFTPIPEEHYNKLPDDKKNYEKLICEIGRRVSYVYQVERNGFGGAVYCCKDVVENEPVLLLLGDTIYRSNENKSCCEQLLEAYEKYGQSMIALQEVPLQDVIHYGISQGSSMDEKENLLWINLIKEKPSTEYAREYLKTVFNHKVKYFAMFGQYILTPEVFKAIESNLKNYRGIQDEIQLTDALDHVREQNGMLGFIPNGKAYDLGTPLMYKNTVAYFE